MSVFTSRIDTQSAEFRKNRDDMLGLVDQLRALEKRAADASAKREKRFRERGQLLPRERLNRLLDQRLVADCPLGGLPLSP